MAMNEPSSREDSFSKNSCCKAAQHRSSWQSCSRSLCCTPSSFVDQQVMFELCWRTRLSMSSSSLQPYAGVCRYGIACNKGTSSTPCAASDGAQRLSAVPLPHSLAPGTAAVVAAQQMWCRLWTVVHHPCRLCLFCLQPSRPALKVSREVARRRIGAQAHRGMTASTSSRTTCNARHRISQATGHLCQSRRWTFATELLRRLARTRSLD